MEQRKTDRLNYYNKARLIHVDSDGEQVDESMGEVLDMSSFGMYCLVQKPVLLGQRLRVELNIGSELIWYSAEVVRALREESGGFGLGITFIFESSEAVWANIESLAYMELV